jgi:hypothetical protein
MASPKPDFIYRYQPPKSSIWGHKLRKMPAHRASSLLEDFFAKATQNHDLVSASITVVKNDLLSNRLADILNLPATELSHTRLTGEQANACLQEVIRLESRAAPEARDIHLNEYFKIPVWVVEGRRANTHSMMTMHYGALPCLTTRLWFETEEEFYFIQQLLDAIGLCKLNKQHLKHMRRPPGAPESRDRNS